VVESFLPGIVAIPVIDDRAGRASVHAELPATVPDGLLLGPDGILYVGCYEPSQVLRVANGAVTTVVADPTAHVLCHPTNLARRGDQLFTANLGRWHLTVIEPAPWVVQATADA
jgi:gluconolactonase